MPPQLSRTQGFVAVLLAGTMFSFGPLTFRAVREADAWQYLFHRALWTGVVAAVVISIGGRSPVTAIRRSGRRQQIAGLLLGTMFGIFVVALSRTTAAFILLLQCTSPFYAALLARVFLGERVSRRTLAAMAVAAIGIVTMVGGNVGGGDPLGIVLSLLLPVCIGAYTTLIRSSPAEDPGAPTVIAGFFAAAVAGIVSLAGPGLVLPARDILLGFLGGGLLIGLGVPLWNYAHRFVPVAEVNLLLVTEVVMAPLWLWLWPGERPTASTLIGGGITLAAVTWLTVVTARAGEMERAPRRVGLNVGSAPGYRRFVRRTDGDR
ncbi:MAG: DMT family transporter [Actinobacteria bacterium]|nr:DMT family transporter [Actinomycetota bacterium]